jgi:hypothetical protein
MSVADCQERISSAEYTDWVAYYNIEPFGPKRDDLRGAQICAVLANINKGRRSKKYKTTDFLFNFKPPEKTIDEMKQIIDGAANRAGF